MEVCAPVKSTQSSVRSLGFNDNGYLKCVVGELHFHGRGVLRFLGRPSPLRG